MELSRKARTLIVGAAAFVVVLLSVVFWYVSNNRAVTWRGIAESVTNGDPAPAEFVLDLKRHPLLFGKPYYTGSVTVNGRRYEDIHAYEYPENPFVPADLKADIGGHQLEVYHDCVIIEEEDGLLRLSVRKNGPFPVYEIDLRG